MVFEVDKIKLPEGAEYRIEALRPKGSYNKGDGMKKETKDDVLRDDIYFKGEKAFLIIHEGRAPLRVEVRTDGNLRKLLMGQYERVLNSKYFGRNGVEIICSGQISEDETYDLMRLSYNLS